MNNYVKVSVATRVPVVRSGGKGRKKRIKWAVKYIAHILHLPGEKYQQAQQRKHWGF